MPHHAFVHHYHWMHHLNKSFYVLLAIYMTTNTDYYCYYKTAYTRDCANMMQKPEMSKHDKTLYR